MAEFRQSILSVSCLRKDHTWLRNILTETPWHIAAVGTCREAKAFLSRCGISVIVCECDLPDGTWRDIMDLAANSSTSPLVIVTSRLADERLWAEVLNLGGYDVLAKPFHEQEVRHVLTSAANQIEGRNTCRAAAS